MFPGDLHLSSMSTIAAKIITKILFKKNCFGAIKFVNITKQALYKANSFTCSLANKDKPVAATLQRKCLGGIVFAIITKIVTTLIVPRNYFAIILARMVCNSTSAQALHCSSPAAQQALKGPSSTKLHRGKSQLWLVCLQTKQVLAGLVGLHCPCGDVKRKSLPPIRLQGGLPPFLPRPPLLDNWTERPHPPFIQDLSFQIIPSPRPHTWSDG